MHTSFNIISFFVILSGIDSIIEVWASDETSKSKRNCCINWSLCCFYGTKNKEFSDALDASTIKINPLSRPLNKTTNNVHTPKAIFQSSVNLLGLTPI